MNRQIVSLATKIKIRNLNSHNPGTTTIAKFSIGSNGCIQLRNHVQPDNHQPTVCRSYHSNSPISEQTKTALVLGSSGCLGSAIVENLKSQCNYTVIGADVLPPSSDVKVEVDAFVPLPRVSPTLTDMIRSLESEIQSLYDMDEGGNNVDGTEGGRRVLDAIVCASGGFSMDNSSDENRDGDAGEVYERMMRMNFYPVVAAGEIASRYMTLDNGLFVAIGATAALSPTPGMQAYGASKAAMHHYLQTLGSITGKTLSGQFKRKRKSTEVKKIRRINEYLDEMTVLGILPAVLDTPSNRKAMPKENFERWTKTKDLAREIGTWVQNVELRPHSGSLIKVVTSRNGIGDGGDVGKYISEFHLVR